MYTMKIILAFFDSSIQVYQRKLDGMQRFAAKMHWHIENITKQEQSESIRRLLDFWSPVGCIVEGGDENRMTRAMFGNCPVVYINHKESASDGGASVVQFDGKACAELAADELRHTGCAHYAFVHPTAHHRWWSDVRGNAFVEFCSASGMPFSVFDPGFRDVKRTEFIRHLRPWLVQVPRPCGVFAANDEVASAVAAACSLEGLQIPKDVSIIGVDDDETICENAEPTLTSVRPDFEGCGYKAAELLDKIMKRPSRRPEVVRYGCQKVVRRNSTRVFKQGYAAIRDAVEYVRLNACRGISPAEVLKLVGGSRRSAEVRFRDFTGRSIGEEITSVRIETAKALLADPSVPIDMVYARCGYEDPSSLRRAFRMTTSLSLREYRLAHLAR